VVEVGTGAGVSGLWLLRGMRPDGVLTTWTRTRSTSGRQAGVRRGRVPSGPARLIVGNALEVLPRLADGGYDLVFVDAAKSEYGDYLTEALRLLRPAAWSRSTTCSGTTGSRTRPSATRTRSPCASSAGPSATPTPGARPPATPATGCLAAVKRA
jgi:hypothetical protein